MGSNSRTSYWHSPEPEQGSVLSFAPNVSFGSWSIEENCAGDLKLGRLGDLNNFVDRLRNPMASASSSGSYKRSRGHSNAMQVPSCLVDGCVTDLSNCRDYHRRHKVCEAHSKTPRVTIEGQEQRFCQQCSRFHSLAEFDDSKRSCRKRLDGHNRRRRKPQPDSLSLNSSKYIPTHQGAKFISYFPNNTLATSSWNGGVKVPNSQLNFITNTFSGSFPQGYRGEKQFPFLYGADPSLHLKSMLGDAGSHSSRKLLFSDGFDPVISCDRASSLLSSSHADTCLFATPPSAPITAHYNGLAMESAPTMDSVLVACSDMDCPQMIQNASDDASHQTISFSWE